MTDGRKGGFRKIKNEFVVNIQIICSKLQVYRIFRFYSLNNITSAGKVWAKQFATAICLVGIRLSPKNCF